MNRIFRLSPIPALSVLLSAAFLFGAPGLTLAQSGPPIITTDVNSTYTAVAGSPLIISAAFSGSAPITYQWTWNGRALTDNSRISGATSEMLTINPSLSSDSGTYQLLATNASGNGASSQAQLTVYPYASFSDYLTDWVVNGVDGWPSFPDSKTLNLTDGDYNSWEAVSAFDTNPVYIADFQATFVYQDTTGGAGADGACFVLQNDPRGPAANGWVAGYLGYGVPSLGAGYFITNSVALEFNIYSPYTVGINFGTNGTVPSSFYSTSPVDLASGDPINVNVTYSAGMLSVLLQDALNPSQTWSTSMALDIPGIIGTNVAYVGFTGGDGSITSDQSIANFTFASAATNMPPTFAELPTNASIYLGQTAVFYSSAASATPESYQWQLNGVTLTNGLSPSGTGATISGATSSNLTITGATLTDDSETYTVVATNSYGSTTGGSATLSVVAGPPSLVTDVQSSYSTIAGSPFTISAAFSGSLPMAYQWTLNGHPLSNGARISGATSNVLTINPAQPGDAGAYQLVVTNRYGNGSSSQAQVTVLPYASFNDSSTGWSLNGIDGEPGFVTANTLELTDGSASPWEAVSSFFDYPVYVGDFQASFVYQDVTGSGGADGACFVVQNDPRGPAANGFVAGYLGYGVPSVGTGYFIANSVALEFNIYAPYTVGINFGTDGSVPSSFYSTSPVNLASGDPINVNVTYNGTTFTVYLQDALNPSQTWSTSIAINIPGIIGTNVAYVGFTGGDSSVTSEQTVSSFEFASLATNAAPTFLTAPTNASIYLGQAALFYSSAASATSVSYQWQLNGVNLTNGRSPSGTGAVVSGVTSSNLTITGATVADSGENYAVVAANINGTAMAGPASLTVVAGPPTVATNVQSAYTVSVGVPITLSAAFVGAQPIAYRWIHNGQALQDSSRISGATTSALTISPTADADAGTYQVLATNSFGSGQSGQAVVTLLPYLSFNGLGASWGVNGIDGTPGFISSNTLELTDGSASPWEAVSSFFDNPVYVGAFQASFVYQDVTGSGGADGACFVVQNDPRGSAANGFVAGYLGYGVPSVGPGYFITNSVALEFNIYAPYTVGVNFGTDGSVPSSFYSTSPVALDSGDPINVKVTYTGTTLSVYLQDSLNPSQTWSTAVGMNIPGIIGTNVGYVGFTGGDSSVTSEQTVSNFAFTSLLNLLAQTSGTNVVLSWPASVSSGDYQLQSNPNLANANGWVNVTNAVVVTNGQNQVTLPYSGSRFFRLKQP